MKTFVIQNAKEQVAFDAQYHATKKAFSALIETRPLGIAGLALLADFETLSTLSEAEAKKKRLPVLALACSKGCDACCRGASFSGFPVVTSVEAAALVEYLLDTLDERGYQALRSRLDEKTPRSNDAPPHPCALLVDGSCIGHRARPLACRGFTSTSREACESAGAIVVRSRRIDTVLALATRTAIEHVLGATDADDGRPLDPSLLDVEEALRRLLPGYPDSLDALREGAPFASLPYGIFLRGADPT